MCELSNSCWMQLPVGPPSGCERKRDVKFNLDALQGPLTHCTKSHTQVPHKVHIMVYLQICRERNKIRLGADVLNKKIKWAPPDIERLHSQTKHAVVASTQTRTHSAPHIPLNALLVLLWPQSSPSAAAPLRLNSKHCEVGGREGGRWTYNSPHPYNTKATEPRAGPREGRGGLVHSGRKTHLHLPEASSDKKGVEVGDG